jgi:hypothetical protein
MNLNPYFDPTETQQRLVNLGFYDLNTVPTVEVIQYNLGLAENYIDEYLCYHAPRSTYTETLHANYKGVIVLSEYPVISIAQVICLRPDIVPNPMAQEVTYSYHMGRRVVGGLIPDVLYEVTYEAGYDPLPPIFQNVMLNILKKLLEQPHPSAIADLMIPSRDISSLGLPGGLSKGWQTGKLTADNDGGQFAGTELGRILSLLKRYQRKVQGVLY